MPRPLTEVLTEKNISLDLTPNLLSLKRKNQNAFVLVKEAMQRLNLKPERDVVVQVLN